MLRRSLLTCCLVVTGACGQLTDEASHRTDAKKETATGYRGSRDLATIEKELTSLESEKEQAKSAQDMVQFHKLQLEINYLTEARNMLAADGHANLDDLARKYEILRRILGDDIAKYEKKAAGRLGGDDMRSVEMKDVPFKGPDFASVYHPLVLAEVQKVFHDFGDLYINATVDSDGKPTSEEARAPTPWAGFWYPFSNKSLYEGPEAPLAKFEQLLKALGHDAKIVQSEVKKFEGYSPDGWEGLCDALSLASVTTKEPTKEKTIHGVTFSIANQKSLHTFSHLKTGKKQYGITFRGLAEDDGTYQDIKPEAFHRIVMKMIGEEHRSIIVDDVASIQVWNKPLYRYRWKIEQDPNIDHAFLVTGYAWLIRERKKETNEPTSDHYDTLTPKYTYRLYVDKKNVKNGKYKVIAGQWTGDSYSNHPDTVVVAATDGSMGSSNPEFNKYLSVYKQYFVDAP